jgi:alpha-L-rhamnosidase
MNDAEAGLKRMQHRYSAMINSELTTLWEGWDIGSNVYGGGTYNHGWTGGPLSLLSGYVAGVQPLANGYQQYIIKPQLGNLNEAMAIVPTAFGNIKIKIIKSTDQIMLFVENINKKNAIVAVPKLKDKKCKYTLLEMNKPSQLQAFNEDEDYFYFRLKHRAEYLFTVKVKE